MEIAKTRDHSIYYRFPAAGEMVFGFIKTPNMKTQFIFANLVTLFLGKGI